MRRRDQHRDLDLQRDTYYAFKDHFERQCVDRDNPGMTLRSFDKLPPESVDKIEIPLENINQINDLVDFGRRVESFREGTKFSANKGASTGKMYYTVFVPWVDPRAPVHRSRHEKRSSGDDGMPSAAPLVLWNLGLVALAAVAWKTTTWAEWVALGRMFGY